MAGVTVKKHNDTARNGGMPVAKGKPVPVARVAWEKGGDAAKGLWGGTDLYGTRRRRSRRTGPPFRDDGHRAIGHPRLHETGQLDFKCQAHNSTLDYTLSVVALRTRLTAPVVAPAHWPRLLQTPGPNGGVTLGYVGILARPARFVKSLGGAPHPTRAPLLDGHVAGPQDVVHGPAGCQVAADQVQPGNGPGRRLCQGGAAQGIGDAPPLGGGDPVPDPAEGQVGQEWALLRSHTPPPATPPGPRPVAGPPTPPGRPPGLPIWSAGPRVGGTPPGRKGPT